MYFENFFHKKLLLVILSKTGGKRGSDFPIIEITLSKSDFKLAHR